MQRLHILLRGKNGFGRMNNRVLRRHQRGWCRRGRNLRSRVLRSRRVALHLHRVTIGSGVFHARQHRCAILFDARLATLAITVATTTATTTATATSATFAFFTSLDRLGLKCCSWLLLLARLLRLRGKFRAADGWRCGVNRLVGARLAAFCGSIALTALSTGTPFLTLRTTLSWRTIFALATIIAFAFAITSIAARTIATTAIATFAWWSCWRRG